MFLLRWEKGVTPLLPIFNLVAIQRANGLGFYTLFLCSVSMQCFFEVFLNILSMQYFFALFLCTVSTQCFYKVFLHSVSTQY